MRRHTTVIAEIGENHVGDLRRAQQMVIEAARAGAEIVKFQSYRGEDVAGHDPEKAWFCQVQLSDEAHAILQAYAEQAGVEFLSSPFTVERARFLCETLGLKKIKIASSELTNRPLLEYVNHRAETVYLSTGMATLEEVREAVGRLCHVRRLVIMHCVSQYPTREEDANLLVIGTLRKAFPAHEVGYSDHTIGILAPIIAVALGASVIEKHFTLDKTLPGTDHICSATPEELAEMVRQIRVVEQLLGGPEKAPTPGELAILEFARGRFPKSES